MLYNNWGFTKYRKRESDCERMFKKFTLDLKKEFKGYNLTGLKKDIFAGITVTTVALPLSLAFGVSSGATAFAGLITAVIAGIVISAFAGASFQISGPTGAMAAVLTALIQRHGLEGVWVAGLMAGVILLLAGLFKFGNAVNLIPAPVVTGFTSGIALIIATSQLDNALGISTPARESAALKLLHYFTASFSPNWYALLICALVIAVMLLWPKKLGSLVPASFAALVIALGVSEAFHLQVDVIGTISKTLLPEDRLMLADLTSADFQPLLKGAVSIALLGMIQTLLCGEVASHMKNERFDANRDLVSQGLGNIVIPFFGGIPANGAIARTIVSIKAGGQTRLAGVFHALGLLVLMLLCGPVMARIPLSALAGVLLVTSWRMNEWSKIKYIFSCRFKGAMAKFIITMTATLVFDLAEAILIGVAFSLVLFVARLSSIRIDIRDVYTEEGEEDTTNDGIKLAFFTGPLFFVTIGRLRNQLMESGYKGVLIASMRGVSHIDVSGIYAMTELYEFLKAENCRLMLCGLQPQVESMLSRGGVLSKIGEDNIFWSADKAISAVGKQA